MHYLLIPVVSAAGVITNAKPVTSILTNILNFLLSVFGVIGIIGLVVSGILYLTAAGDEGRLRTAKRLAVGCSVGIVVVLGALLMVTQISSLLS